jgi:peptidoglycan-N-acetylglucosamine deacetylase
MSEKLSWPGDAEIAVALTFDVDGDPSLESIVGAEAAQRLSTASYFRYGPTNGVKRILEVLATRAVPATFYVPGATALAYPDSMRAIAAGGHEIAHHGHHHLKLLGLPAELQRDEVERGVEALQSVTGTLPRGYRAPFGELTPETLALLVTHGFVYDSSCQGDDSPYLEAAGKIVELPFAWELVDASHFFALGDIGRAVGHPDAVMGHWWTEFEEALARQQMLTLVLHPEIIGRGAKLAAFASLIDRMLGTGRTWFATHRQVADLVLAAVVTGSPEERSGAD